MTAPSHTAPPAAKDLAREDPRPMDATLDGYPWLPRMIDKARAAHAGTLGTYYRYPCPIDTECLDRLDLDAGAFIEIACRAVPDSAVIDQLVHVGARLERLAGFDPVALNAALHADDK